ncbi:MAG: hypothetical protein QG670_109 [Thermoproteota archaeon]|nr:hypothetical protein [Thermoproteota archaeon]
MPGILGTKADLRFDLNLLLQILILTLVLVGSLYAKKKKFVTHGKIMTTAIAIHTALILLVMGPSFIIYFNLLLQPQQLFGVIVTWVHVILGTLAEVLGFYIVLKWKYNIKSISACAKRRKLMIPVRIFWVTSLILGIAFYIYYYL